MRLMTVLDRPIERQRKKTLAVNEVSLVAVDLDGTLLTSAGSVAPEGAHLLRLAARQGVRVVLATSRNPDAVRFFCRLLEINDPIICTNGAQVWASPDGPVWAHHAIPRQVALTLAEWADMHDWELSVTVGATTYWRQRPGQALGPITPHVTVVSTNADAITGDPLRMLAHQPEAINSLRSLCQQFPAQCYAQVHCKPDGTAHSLGMFAPSADKGTALALVCERLGIGRENVMAIGDNINDLPMFPHAQLSVTMGNAPQVVKQKVNIIAPSNDEEGVAWALQRFVLTEKHGVKRSGKGE